ncbi:MAG: N-6 DNA methylase [Oscillospiraceae bacterium]|nr:N-6 DNA methylase [Oscillospiraceae bacterium]
MERTKPREMNRMNNDPEISEATLRNWQRLGTSPESRLTSRANKKGSKKRFIPLEYLRHKESAAVLQSFLNLSENSSVPAENAVYSLCVNYLRQKGIINLPHVKRVMAEYDNISYAEELWELSVPENEFDFIGAAYQSLLSEGKKNTIGSYYTPEKIAAEMTKEAYTAENRLFLDPCCGSGAFLLAAHAEEPSYLFGCDIDPIAVMIAKANLLCRYPNKEFEPNIRHGDYLNEDIFPGIKFGSIASNPPWGAVPEQKTNEGAISSGESFSRFFEKAYSALCGGGVISFLFPEAILNVRTHRDIRKFILNNCRIRHIKRYDGGFSGVATGFAELCAEKAPSSDSLIYSDSSGEREISTSAFYETKNNNFLPLSQKETDIIRKVKNAGAYTLAASVWGLGIVTGDNKNKLLSEQISGTEPVFTGREIFPYKLKAPAHYIRYDRASFQQTAREEIYRAPEKLVYRFISDRLVFACDTSGSLFLNSANILIPKIPDMSVKTVMAFLNSPLYSFFYAKLFGEIKILRGNLSRLPFPCISPELDKKLNFLAESAMQNGKCIEEINRIIYGIFGLTEEEIRYIEK